MTKGDYSVMKAENPNSATRSCRSYEPGVGYDASASPSGVSRREFFNLGLAGAALLALTGCASFRGSESDLDRATTDLRNLLEGFEGDGARQARLASIGQTEVEKLAPADARRCGFNAGPHNRLTRSAGPGGGVWVFRFHD